MLLTQTTLVFLHIGTQATFVVGGGDTTHVFKGSHKIWIGFEAALFGNVGQTDAWLAVDKVLCFLDACALYERGGCHAGDGDHLAIELAVAHAHGGGECGHVHVFVLADEQVDGVCDFVQELQVGGRLR